MNMPYGYNNMTSFNSRPRFNNSMGRGGGGGPMMRPAAKVLTLSEVQNWLDRQQPFVLQSVMKTCSNLLVNKHKVPVDDLSDWYKEPEDEGKSGTLLEGGVDPATTAKNLKRDLKPGVGSGSSHHSQEPEERPEAWGGVDQVRHEASTQGDNSDEASARVGDHPTLLSREQGGRH